MSGEVTETDLRHPLAGVLSLGIAVGSVMLYAAVLGLVIILIVGPLTGENAAATERFIDDLAEGNVDFSGDIPEDMQGVAIAAVVLGLCTIMLPLAPAIGLTVGIVALLQPNARRAYGIVGTAINALVLLGSCCMIIYAFFL